jgi:hypothetical protein
MVHVVPVRLELELEREDEKKLSATALSQQFPLRLMLGWMPWLASSAR